MGNETKTLQSPSGALTLIIGTQPDSPVWYELKKNDEIIINRSELTLIDSNEINLLETSSPFKYKETSRDETWEQPWGEQRFIRDNHNEIAVIADTFTIRFRLFDDSLGFRYELTGSGEVTILKELPFFNIDPTSEAWWIPELGQNHY